MSVASLHGELTKVQRQTTLAAFRRGALAPVLYLRMLCTLPRCAGALRSAAPF